MEDTVGLELVDKEQAMATVEGEAKQRDDAIAWSGKGSDSEIESDELAGAWELVPVNGAKASLAKLVGREEVVHGVVALGVGEAVSYKLGELSGGGAVVGEAEEDKERYNEESGKSSGNEDDEGGRPLLVVGEGYAERRWQGGRWWVGPQRWLR